MKLLFPALEARFNSDLALVTAARKLYEGFGGDRAKGVLPYVEVHRRNAGQSDTFGKDIELYDLQFSIFGKHQYPDMVNDIVEHMIRVFDDAALVGNFSLVSIRRSGGNGPFLRDGVFQALMFYEVQLQRLVNHPVVRGL